MKYFIFLLFGFFCFASGMISYKNKIFHDNLFKFVKDYIFNEKIEFELTNYNHGDLIYLDREYRESLHPTELHNTLLIRTNRHANGFIYIETSEAIKIYRLLSIKNNNQQYYDWEKSNSKVYLEGAGVDHEIMVHKNFGVGTHKLKLGSPFSADPIFILRSSKKSESLLLAIRSNKHF